MGAASASCVLLSPQWLTLHLAYLVNCSLALFHFVYAIWSGVARRAAAVSSFPFTSNATPPDRNHDLLLSKPLVQGLIFLPRLHLFNLSVFCS